MSWLIAQNKGGALPLTFKFQVPITGDVTLAFSGTCWSTTPATLGGVTIALDGKILGTSQLCFNQASMHMTLPTMFFPITLGDGAHTVTLTAIGNTVSDANDYFSLWILD